MQRLMIKEKIGIAKPKEKESKMILILKLIQYSSPRTMKLYLM